MSRTSPLAFLLFGVVLVTSACSDSASNAPTSPSGPQYQIGTGPACSPNDLTKAAAALAGRRSALVDLAGLISSKNANSPAATATAFNMFAEVARLADAGHAAGTWTAQNSADGASVTVLAIACADVALSGQNTLAVFTAALDAAGLYEVRGGGSDATGPAIAHDGMAGVQAPGTGFGVWMSGRGLFYGYPIATFSTEIFGGYAMDVSVVRPIPRPADTPAALVGDGVIALCANVNPQPFTDDQLRIQKTSRILPIASGAFVPCSAPAAVSASSARLGPNFALAAAATGIGGTIRNFSPHEIVFPGTVNLTFVSQPLDGTANVPLASSPAGGIVVSVKAQNGTPWEGVRVQLDGVNNNGNFVAACNNIADTDEQGLAHFPDFSLNKAGGFRLLAHTVPPTTDPDVNTFTPDSTTSLGFNLKNSSDPSPCS